jgi:hypothetical protein
MTNPKEMHPETPMTSTESRKNLLKEIGTKWNKFSEHDVSVMKNKDDLVNQIVAKYSIEKGQAQKDADALLKGRVF